MKLKERKIVEVKEASEREMTLKECELAEAKSAYLLFVEMKGV